MALLDFIALLVLVLFTALGAWRGVVAGAVSIASLVVGYLAGGYCAIHYGPALAEITDQPTFLAAPIAGTLGFVGAFLVMALAGFFITRWDKRRVEGMGRSALDRIGGGAFGAVRGLLIVLLLGILSNWLAAAKHLSAEGEASAAATTPLQAATQQVVAGGLSAALGNSPEAEVAAQIVARPTESLAGLRNVVEHPRMQELAGDRHFWTLVSSGSVDAALNRGSFYGILHDPELRSELAAVGLVTEGAAQDPAVFRLRAREVLTEIGPRIARARHDRELHALARDPEIAGLLERRDVLGLLRNRRFSRTVERLLAEES